MIGKLQWILTSVGGLLSLVPGIQALRGSFVPPEVSSLFGVGLSVTGVATLTIILLSAQHIEDWKLRRVIVVTLISLAGTLGVLVYYHDLYDEAVASHYWDEDEGTRILVPLNVDDWAPTALDSIVNAARDGPIQETYSSADIGLAISRFGPGRILPMLSGPAKRKTVRKLFFIYCGAVVLLVCTTMIPIVCLYDQFPDVARESVVPS